jgi:type VI protein secretion system component VasK
MHFLAAIILVLFLIFGDRKTKLQMVLFFGGIVGWIAAFVQVINLVDEKDSLAPFGWFLLATLISIVLLIRYLVKIWDESQAQELEEMRAQRQLDREKYKADREEYKEKLNKAREERKIKQDLFDNDVDEYLRHYGTKRSSK